jgi:hypothetical protein
LAFKGGFEVAARLASAIAADQEVRGMPAIGMVGQLTEVMLIDDGSKVLVRGTFDPGDNDIHKAKVLFLIVQGDGDKKTVIVEGEAEWKRTRKRGGGDWTVLVDNEGVFPKPDGPAVKGSGASHNSKACLQFKGTKLQERMVRGIALAIAIKPAKPATQLELKGRFNPPQIEALTWCVELALTRDTPATAQNGSKRARRNGSKRPRRRQAVAAGLVQLPPN